MPSNSKIIIEGITEEGKTFRPSDWIERICGSLSAFGNDRRIRYSRYVQPQIIEGKRCLVIDGDLRDKNPAAFNFLIDFGKANKLRLREWNKPQGGENLADAPVVRN